MYLDYLVIDEQAGLPRRRLRRTGRLGRRAAITASVGGDDPHRIFGAVGQSGDRVLVPLAGLAR